MKFVLAPDKFKGSLSGPEFCVLVQKIILRYLPAAEIVALPLADGGDGTAEVLEAKLGAKAAVFGGVGSIVQTYTDRLFMGPGSKVSFY